MENQRVFSKCYWYMLKLFTRSVKISLNYKNWDRFQFYFINLYGDRARGLHKTSWHSAQISIDLVLLALIFRTSISSVEYNCLSLQYRDCIRQLSRVKVPNEGFQDGSQDLFSSSAWSVRHQLETLHSAPSKQYQQRCLVVLKILFIFF